MLVVPNKYVEELRAVPEEKLSSMVANVDVRILALEHAMRTYFNRTFKATTLPLLSCFVVIYTRMPSKPDSHLNLACSFRELLKS
jgi:hypothetical protein